MHSSGISWLTRDHFKRDLIASIVILFVALPLCLGIALASRAPLFSGLIAGVVGGIVVGILSRSHTSVSGPAAGLTVVVAAEIEHLGAFSTFLLAVLVAGIFQVVAGLLRGGFIGAFFPSSVIRGLLAAIGLLLILKNIPHLLGHDTDPEGEMAFSQPDHENTFSEILSMFHDIQLGAAIIGCLSLALLFFWDSQKRLKELPIPAPLVVVLLGVALSAFFRMLGDPWLIQESHLVQVPIAKNWNEFVGFITLPDFTQWVNPAVYQAAITIALVASLETLLNLEAIDKLDPKQRVSPPNRELVAQGVGNVCCGLLGGIPVTSVVVRSTVNISAGGQTKMATILHGSFLLGSILLIPQYLNLIPISCLAAILFSTGLKLTSPKVWEKSLHEGRYQFIPFAATVVSIIFTDLLVGVLIGLGISLAFILRSNFRWPIKVTIDKHLGGDVTHLHLGNQLSFLNRATLERTLDAVPRGGHVLLDATATHYIDPDILSLLHEYRDRTAPIRGVQVSLRGFRPKFQLPDEIHYVESSTRELRDLLTPDDVLTKLIEGNERFASNLRIHRDSVLQLQRTSSGQYPMAVVLSCIDSRTPVEMIFDLGLGDIFSIRIAGNVVSPKVFGSIEYACAVAGAKLVLVMGHTRCGAVLSSIDLRRKNQTAVSATGCQHLDSIVKDIQSAIDTDRIPDSRRSPEELEQFANHVTKENVRRSVELILQQSETIRELSKSGKVLVAAAIYDVSTGRVEMLPLRESRNSRAGSLENA